MTSFDFAETRLACAALLLATGLFWGGCDRKQRRQTDDESATADGSAAQQQERDRFVAGSEAEDVTVALDAFPDEIDTVELERRAPGRHLAYNLFEGLVKPAATTEGAESPSDRVRPGLARDWTIEDDGRTYTFQLRRDMAWSDGEPVTAEDVVFAWKRLLDPERDSEYADLLDVVEGAGAYHRGDVDSWNAVGLEVPDPHTLVVHLERRAPHFLELMTLPGTYPQPRHVLDAHGEEWTTPEHLQTNGPYELVAYDAERGRIVLEKRADYWNAEGVALERVVLRAFDDESKAIEAYRDEMLHWIATPLSMESLSTVRGHDDHVREPLLATWYFQFDPVDREDDPAVDPKLRRALSLTLNRERIADRVLDRVHERARALVPPDVPGYTSTLSLDYNVSRARDLFEEGGYENQDPTLTLVHRSNPDARRLADAVREIWGNNLDLTLEIEELSPSDYRDALASHRYDVALTGRVGAVASPEAFLARRYLAIPGWSNETYERLREELGNASAGAERTNVWQRIESMMVTEEALFAPIVHPVAHMLVSERLEGFEPHHRNIHLLQDLEMAESTAPSASQTETGEKN